MPCSYKCKKAKKSSNKPIQRRSQDFVPRRADLRDIFSPGSLIVSHSLFTLINYIGYWNYFESMQEQLYEIHFGKATKTLMYLLFCLIEIEKMLT